MKAEAKKAGREAASREEEKKEAEMVVCNALNLDRVAEEAKGDGNGRLETIGPIGIDPPPGGIDRAKVLLMPINIDDVHRLLAAIYMDEIKVVCIDSCVSATPSLLVAHGGEKSDCGITKWLSERCPSASGSGSFSETLCRRPIARTAASGPSCMRHTGGSPATGDIEIADACLWLVQDVAEFSIRARTIGPLLSGVMKDHVLRVYVFDMGPDPS